MSSADKLNIGYKIEKPIRLIDGVTMTPSVALLIQDYNLAEKSFSRSYNEYGMDIHASMYQIIPYLNRIWEISELTQVMKFSAGLRFTEILNGNALNPLPDIYSPVEDLNLEPLDMLDFRGSKRLAERKLIRLGWENNILGKWKDTSRRLLSMHTYYDINFISSNASEDRVFIFCYFNPSNLLV